MPLFIVDTERHHNAERCGSRQLFRLEGFDPEAEALAPLIASEICGDEDEIDLDKLRAAVAKARIDGEAKFEYGEEDQLVAIWHTTENGKTNFGFGASSDGTVKGTDKYENLWVEVKPYVPDEKVRAKLTTLSKDQLIEMLLEVYAENGLTLPDGVSEDD